MVLPTLPLLLRTLPQGKTLQLRLQMMLGDACYHREMKQMSRIIFVQEKG